MANWGRRIALLLIVVGLVLLFGGFTIATAGDVVNVSPFWVLGIGSAMLGGGAHLYFRSLQ